MQIQVAEEKPVKTIQGKVVDGNEDVLIGSFVEVFKNEEPDNDTEDDSAQKRLAGCEIGEDGKFCFTKLPAGKYAVRVSQTGFDTLTILVEVSPRGISKKIEAVMKPSD